MIKRWMNVSAVCDIYQTGIYKRKIDRCSFLHSFIALHRGSRDKSCSKRRCVLYIFE